MPAVIVRPEELRSRLKLAAKAHGLHCAPAEHGGLRADLETTLARWYFGGRAVTYYMSCQLDEDAHAVRFRELVRETTWGLPAPFFVAEKATVTETRVSGRRPEEDAGAGPVEYFRVRADIERTVHDAGWRFVPEAGKP